MPAVRQYSFARHQSGRTDLDASAPGRSREGSEAIVQPTDLAWLNRVRKDQHADHGDHQGLQAAHP